MARLSRAGWGACPLASDGSGLEGGKGVGRAAPPPAAPAPPATLASALVTLALITHLPLQGNDSNAKTIERHM